MGIGVSVDAQWQVVADDHLPSASSDAVVKADGSLRANTNLFTSIGLMDRAFIVSYTSSGIPVDSTELAWPSAVVMATRLYEQLDGGGLYATGLHVDTFPSGMLQQGFVAEVNPASTTMTRYGPTQPATLDGLGFVDTDGSLVFGHYDFTDFDLADFTFRASRYCPGTGMCDSVLILEQTGIGRMHAMARLADQTMVGVMPMTSDICSFHVDGVIRFNDDLDVLDCLPLYPLDTGMFDILRCFRDNISILPVGADRMIVCGMYDGTNPTNAHPVAVQHARLDGPPLGQIRFYNAADEDAFLRPGIMRGLSAFDAGTFAFAYSDHAFSGPIPYMQETSNIHVLRMDTALNILGTYVFNGGAINRYHYLSSVVAAPDGAVYVVGSVYDHNDAVPKPKAWVARVAPEQFVHVPEVEQAYFSLGPNPGTDGFFLRSENAFGQALVQLIDMQGRIVLNTRLQATPSYVDASGLRSGMYLARVTARDGSTWTARWVKE